MCAEQLEKHCAEIETAYGTLDREIEGEKEIRDALAD